MGNTADIGPEIGSRASENTNVRCDKILDDVGRAQSNPLYLLIAWRSSGRHVELRRLM